MKSEFKQRSKINNCENNISKLIKELGQNMLSSLKRKLTRYLYNCFHEKYFTIIINYKKAKAIILLFLEADINLLRLASLKLVELLFKSALAFFL